MAQWRLKLLYDGDCPFCRREVEWLKGRDKHGQLAFEDIGAIGFDPARYGVTRDEAMRVLHGVLPDGRVVRGVDTIREAYRAIGLGWLVAPTSWPGLHWIAERCYTFFAKYRIPFGNHLGRSCCPGGACRMKNEFRS
ncbi:MAG: thiol-disulfide oxidoreductase DCC family protein [Thermoguttaceae bacterium]